MSDIQTTFSLSNGDVLTYRIPKLVDPEGNDVPEVYVGKMDAQEDKYPPFLMYENATQTVILRPNSTQVQGRTYYFSIVVKEKNSDTIKYPYFCTIKVDGEIVEDTSGKFNWTDINYSLNWLQNYKGSLKFSHPVNMTWLEQHFNEFFYPFWTDTDYNTNKIEQRFKNFEPDFYAMGDNQTVNFTMTFFAPYNIGLLNKKSDYLKFRLKQSLQENQQWYEGLYIGNASEIRMALEANTTK